MKNNDIKNDNSQNEPLNTTQPNLYPSMNYPLQNSNIIQINRHQDLIFYLRQIADNTAENRRSEENDTVSLIATFLIGLFLIYMGISFYRAGGFDTLVGPKLFFMIIGIFLLIIILHREEQINTLNNITKKKS